MSNAVIVAMADTMTERDLRALLTRFFSTRNRGEHLVVMAEAYREGDGAMIDRIRADD